MRNKIFLNLLFFSILSYGCSDDDEDGSIEGTWDAADVAFDLRLEGQTISSWFVNEVGLSQAQSDGAQSSFEQNFRNDFLGSLTFNEDGSFSSAGNPQPSTGTWQLDDDRLTVTSATPGEDAIIFEIGALTSEGLLLEFNQTVERDLDGNGTVEELLATIDWSFVKRQEL